MDENFPRLPDVESSQSLQGVEMSEIAAMNGLFRMSGNSHLNLKMTGVQKFTGPWIWRL